MSKIYKFQSGAVGWTAKTYADPEIVANEILSFALAHPTGFLGVSNDGALHFKGVTIRFNHNMEQLGYKITVEFIGDVKRIKQGFFDMYMRLVDVGLILTEPSERVEIDGIFDTEIMDVLKRSHRDKVTLLLAAAKIKAEPMSSVGFCDLKLKTVAKNYLDESQYLSAIYYFTEEIKFRFPKIDPEEEIEIMRVKELGVNPRNLYNWAKVLKNQENKK